MANFYVTSRKALTSFWMAEKAVCTDNFDDAIEKATSMCDESTNDYVVLYEVGNATHAPTFVPNPTDNYAIVIMDEKDDDDDGPGGGKNDEPDGNDDIDELIKTIFNNNLVANKEKKDKK